MRRIGIYVDASNIGMNGGSGMRYEILRHLACRSNGIPQRLNVYLPFDQLRASSNIDYLRKASAYQAALRDQGFRITVKPVQRFTDEEGQVTLKSNTDLDMAVDILTESERLDAVLLATGDGDFVQVARALQSKGCRVEVLAFENVSRQLIDHSDQFINGYLIPNLVPIRDVNGRAKWGEIGSRVRGYCKTFDDDGQYGFLSYWDKVPDALIAATEMKSAYFHAKQLTERQNAVLLPSRTHIFEFDLAEPSKQGGWPEARNVSLVTGPKNLSQS